MAVRIHEIPGLQGQQINAPQVSVQAATAPARALGDVAQGIANAGEAFGRIGERIQGYENARAESETRMNWTTSYADLKLELAKDPDPTSHQARVAAFLQERKADLDQPGLAPVVRDRLTLQFDDFAGRATMDTARGAAELAVRRGTLALNNEVEAGISSGNPAAVERAVQTGLDSGVLLPEEAEKIRRDGTTTIRKNALLTEAATDPVGYIDRYKDKAPEGLNELEHLDQLATARRALATETADTSAEILDGIVAKNITTPEQIDSLTLGLRPVAVESLKRALADRGDAATRALKASPAYQASAVAKVQEMLDAWTVETDGYDEAYVEMARIVRDLPPGAVRDELSRNLETSRSGQVKVIETAADYQRQQLTDLHQAGAFGNPAATVRRPVTDFVRDGLLKDPAKLEKTGIPPETARKIAEEKDPREQVALLKKARAEAAKEGGFLDTNEPFDRQVFDSILKGDGMLEAADLAAREKARRAYGLAKTKLEDWLKLHPEANEDQGREALLRITGETAIPGLVDQILSAPPAWGDGSGGMVLPDKPQD